MVKRLTNPFLGAPTPLGSLMTAAGQRLASELDAALSAAGFPDLRSAHAPVFMAIDPEGTRVTELARRTRMTKQAVGELVRYLAGRGYVTVAADPEDGRARRVSLTETGCARHRHRRTGDRRLRPLAGRRDRRRRGGPAAPGPRPDHRYRPG